MIKLLELSFEGIGRFTQRQSIDFRNRGKLIQVDGKNMNTGGSSGAAKSTVFHALDYLLGINKTPATALQSRIGKHALVVEGIFDIDGVDVRIVRSKKEGLSLYIGEESITGNVDLAEERLQDLIGIPLNLFKKMVHKKQKEGGFFLKMTASESYKFLIKVLGLESWTDKIAKIDEDVKKMKEEDKTLTKTVETCQVLKDDIQKTIDLLVKPEAPINTGDINAYQAQIDLINGEISSTNLTITATKKVIDDLDAQRQATIDQLAIPERVAVLATNDTLDNFGVQLAAVQANKAKYVQQLNTQKEEKRKAINDQQIKITQIKGVQDTLPAIVENIQKLKEQKIHIEAAQCPTCSQTWTGDGATQEIASISAKISALADQAWNVRVVAEGEPAIVEAKTALEAELKALEDDQGVSAFEAEAAVLVNAIAAERAEISQSVVTQQNIYNLAKSQYDNQVLKIKEDFSNLLAVHTASVSNLELAIKDKESVVLQNQNLIDQSNRQMTDFNVQLNNYMTTTASLTKNLQDRDLELTIAEQSIQTIKKKIAIAEEAKRVVKNYTLQIFQESLDYIGEQASSIVSKIPNMANATIYFEGCKETKTGNLKDEINAIINMDGENDIPIKTLSGGEETAIELAVDLAVIEMIEHKAGKGADFFILDEPFDGLDSVCKEQCLDLLQLFDTNKKIIIVDHSSELKAMVNEIITVVREGEESRILT